MPASTKNGGTCLGAPDVCKVPAPPAPPVPTPFPNKGDLSGSGGTAKKVKFDKGEAFTMKSKVKRSMGDEAGTLKGMMSNKNMEQCKPKKGSGKVKAQGGKVVFATSPFGHNGSNANAPPGAQIAPSQTKVLVAAWREDLCRSYDRYC